MISNFTGERLKWMFKVLRKTNRNCYNHVPTLVGVDMRFFNHHYLSTSRSLVLRSGLKTINLWNMETLKTRLPNCDIEILNHRDKYTEPDKHKEQQVFKTTLHSFIDLLINVEKSNNFYSVPFNNNEKQFQFLIDDIEPIEILESIQPCYIWLGPKGTITPWHYDVQNIVMGQLIGRKRVLLIPSWDFPLINNNYKTFAEINYDKPIINPTLDQPQIFEVILNPGDLLFVPIGWAHYVEGLETSLTLSFTGFNYDNDYYSFMEPK